MKFNVATFIAALAGLASGQDVSQIPACGRRCITDSFSRSGCSSQYDFLCVCKAPVAFDVAIGCCTQAHCTQAEVEKIINWKTTTCQDLNITWVPPPIQGACK